MPHLSKRKLDPKVYRELVTLFEYVLGHLNSKDAQELLTSLFSETEKLMLAKRIATVFMIDEKIPYSHISDTLKLSPDTVHKIALEMETPKGNGFQIAINKLNDMEREKLFKKILTNAIRIAIRSAGGRPLDKVYY